MEQGSTASAANAREEANAALKERPWDSAVSATKVAAGVLTICVAIASVVVQANKHSVSLLVGMGLAVLASWPAGHIAFELKRLSRCRRALKEVLRSEKIYEDLLRDTRQQRDQAIAERNAAEVRGAIQTEAVRAFALLEEHLTKIKEQQTQIQELLPKNKRRTT